MTGLEELFAARVAVIIPDAVSSVQAAAARRRIEIAGYARYAMIDRGSYHLALSPDEPELRSIMSEAASVATGRALDVVDSRVVRLGPGDYLLAHHDRSHDDELVEAVLDLSEGIVDGAEIHYRRQRLGQVFFRVPSLPGSLSIVERSTGMTCNHTYLSLRHTASVVRLVLRLCPR
jgi:hypothetical protein